MQIEREGFYKTEEIIRDIGNKIQEAKEKGEHIDYLTFVPDGEPTLDKNIGEEIQKLKKFGIKIGIITNSSLIWDNDVKEGLLKADWISFKVDSISEEVWKRVDRPFRTLKLTKILQGIKEFSSMFRGDLTTETMLIKGVNDNKNEIEKIANFISDIKPLKAYIAIPTRPPAENWVEPADENIINMSFQVFERKKINVEYLIGYEGSSFAFTGNVEDDLLSITSVHPMREEGISEFLRKARADWMVIERLIKEGKLIETYYEGKKFFMRKLPGRKTN
ncbi:MAG: radical SAM protein [Candidatus Cloacimonas sp. 4484_209]|nr:MAG: radical SAM protein [Candidatus Cloacimonas sp. 4484_209]